LNHLLPIIVSISIFSILFISFIFLFFYFFFFILGRYYAVQLGTEILSQDSSPDVKNTVITLLDKLEQEKRQLIEKLRDPENGAPYVTNFALQIFDKADTEDQEGKATKSVTSSH